MSFSIFVSSPYGRGYRIPLLKCIVKVNAKDIDPSTEEAA